MKVIEWNRFITLVHRALADGSQPDPPVIRHDISLHCENPYEICLTSFPPKGLSPIQTYDYSDASIRTLYMDTACRKCETCGRNRSRYWAQRARAEIIASPRTWFCTYTINPHWRFMFSLRSGSTNFHDSYQEISKEITKYYKRLRKAGFKFKYVCIAESHKDGYPHIHMLIHEVSGPIPKRRLEGEWPYGFTNIKLVDSPQAAWYITKYLSKDMRTRVRASQHYGAPDIVDIESLLANGSYVSLDHSL